MVELNAHSCFARMVPGVCGQSQRAVDVYSSPVAEYCRWNHIYALNLHAMITPAVRNSYLVSTK